MFVLIASALGAAPRDPCTQLCNRDGPAICTRGSWTKDNGTCQAYVFRGEPARGDYCYHTGATAATCPGRGQPVRATDVPRLLAGAGRGMVDPSASTTTARPAPTTTLRSASVVQPPRAPENPPQSSELRLTELTRIVNAEALRRRDRNPRDLEVSRRRVFTDSLSFLNGDVRAMYTYLPHIRFRGELGYDAGGLDRDWFTQLGRQVFTSPSTDPNGGLFRQRDGSDFIEIDTSRPLNAHSTPHYRAVGRLLAVAVAQRRPLGAHLPRAFFRRLLDRPVEMADIAQDDPQIHRNLVQAQRWDEATLRSMIGLGPDEPCPSAAEYVAERLRDFVPVAADSYIAEIRRGFNDLIPVASVRAAVIPDDLYGLIYGSPEISVDDLMAHTRYDDRTFTAASRQIGWLWDWLRRSTNEVRRNFLRFLTGMSTLPMGGMAALRGNLYIGGPTAADLGPRSHTCSFALDMPVYHSAAQLEEYMGVAVASDGFGQA